MTFEQWWKKWWRKRTAKRLDADLAKGIAGVAWDAALAESGTTELYEACKEALTWLDSDSRGSESAVGQCQAAIAKYEACVGAKP